MNELRPHGRELLAAARRELSPTPAERERVLNELLATIEPAPTSTAPGARRKLEGSARFLLLTALACAIVIALYVASSVGH